jgi:hypothetical protein
MPIPSFDAAMLQRDLEVFFDAAYFAGFFSGAVVIVSLFAVAYVFFGDDRE